MYEILDTEAFMLVDTPVCETLAEAKARVIELTAKFGLKECRLVPIVRGV